LLLKAALSARRISGCWIGGCAFRRLYVCIVAGTAQRGGELEIIDNDIAQTIRR
jgi:hypothetical protein